MREFREIRGLSQRERAIDGDESKSAAEYDAFARGPESKRRDREGLFGRVD